MQDLISRQAAIDMIANNHYSLEYCIEHHIEFSIDVSLAIAKLSELPSAQTNVPDTNVGDTISRKGVFIPDITVEMFRNASLEGVEDLMASGEMEDISLLSAQPEEAIPVSWIESRIERFMMAGDAFSGLTASIIRVILNEWEKEQERRTDG